MSHILGSKLVLFHFPFNSLPSKPSAVNPSGVCILIISFVTLLSIYIPLLLNLLPLMLAASNVEKFFKESVLSLINRKRPIFHTHWKDTLRLKLQLITESCPQGTESTFILQEMTAQYVR